MGKGEKREKNDAVRENPVKNYTQEPKNEFPRNHVIIIGANHW